MFGDSINNTYWQYKKIIEKENLKYWIKYILYWLVWPKEIREINKILNNKPSIYDILATLAIDENIRDFNDFCDTLWYDINSIENLKIYENYSILNNKLIKFFTSKEIEELQYNEYWW